MLMANPPYEIDHFEIWWRTDDDATIVPVDPSGKAIGSWSCNYDDLGRGGMSQMIDLINELATLLDVTVVTVGHPGV